MPHDAAFHQGLHCLISLKQSSGTEILHFKEFLNCDPLKYKIDNSKLIVSIWMGESIRMKRVNSASPSLVC